MKTIRIITISCAALLFAMCKKNEEAKPGFDYHFHENMITSDIPGDVNPELYASLNPATSLDTANWANLAKLKRIFNIYSWQSLLAINWPVDKEGKPLANFTDRGTPEWLEWKEYYEVFRCNGAEPTPWGSERIAPKDCNEHLLTSNSLQSLSLSAIQDRGKRILFMTDKNQNFANETDQAFAYPLKDKNGNLVYYEILLNREEYDYLDKNKLYNFDGQIAYANQKPGVVTPANFPSGIYGKSQKGAIEIKLAWRILEIQKGDDPSRYITTSAMVLSEDGKTFTRKLAGLVGFHISQKPTSSAQWVWSTFEHVDNLNTANLNEAINGKKNLEPSFYKNYQPTLITDEAQFLDNKEDKTHLEFTQCERRIPIPADVQEINNEVRAMLRKMGSKWQYYELIDTQWPTDPSAAPTVYAKEKNNTVESITNKAGGNPTPVYLTNITMETYFQKGNQKATNQIESLPDGSPVSNDTPVFGTESCIGCHSSASICIGKGDKNKPVGGGQLTGDFSWLLSQKATWRKPAAPVTENKVVANIKKRSNGKK